MNNLSSVFAKLRRGNFKQYTLLAFCQFISVLLITSYSHMMRSPTVLNVLPVGGDSRKQIMMIFVLAVIGCGVFTAYAGGLFLRSKSRESGILMALGARKKQIRRQLVKELSVLSLISCLAGAILGIPLAYLVWQFFRMAVVDTEDMVLNFSMSSYTLVLVFIIFVIATLFFMMQRSIKRTNILDVVNESRKTEPIKEVKQYYCWLGIVLMVVGGLLGYFAPTFCILVLHWYAPEWLTGIAYTPAFVGLYMILLHTVVNGWRKGSSRYKGIISTSMMKFQGRQTVRSMLVITVLVAGAYFASFYTPMMETESGYASDLRPYDYGFQYRDDQNMITKRDIYDMADQEDVEILDYAEVSLALLGVDGTIQVETESKLGITYDFQYLELAGSNLFISESDYFALMGERLNIMPGEIVTIVGDDGGGFAQTDVTLLTNTVTGETLSVTPSENLVYCSMFVTWHILSDEDYAKITQGLSDQLSESFVAFNVKDNDLSYNFAKSLFHEIVEHSGPEVEQTHGWDPVKRELDIQEKGVYFLDSESLEDFGFTELSYYDKDSSNFRMNWKYMPMFRVMDQADFTKNMAVYLMIFVFIAIVCFAALIVIVYTRSVTIALSSAQIYEDLKKLGASNKYRYKTLRDQISKVFFAPILIGTLIISGLYLMIMFFNDGQISPAELQGLSKCALVIIVMSAVLYMVYRLSLRRTSRELSVSSK